MDKKIYCFDLDETLCMTEGQDYANTKPIKKRIKKVNRLYDKGNMIIISTGRNSIWKHFTKKQLKKWGLRYHSLHIGLKPIADYYIDDKGISDKDFFKDL
jgi:histidinol phosphatase-like enzyme